MRVIITEEQLKYITSQELLNEGLINKLATLGGKVAKRMAQGTGHILRHSNNKTVKKAGLKLVSKSRKGMPKVGAIRKEGGTLYRFDGTKWKTLLGKDAESVIKDKQILSQLQKVSPNPTAGEVRNINGKLFSFDGTNWNTHDLTHTLNTQRKNLTGAEKIGKATKIGLKGGAYGAIGYGVKKAYDRGKEAIEGLNDFRELSWGKNPSKPVNTGDATSQEILQSMGFSGEGKSILEPKDTSSFWGQLYDKYGKNQ